MISRICIKRPSAGISIQPKSQIRMMIKAIHNRIDMLITLNVMGLLCYLWACD
jgi:hypothetical protein